ncbi:hypothetical protein EON65_14500 [archaeon]|nr:MAG: hypothetical protein EON65_14500 [archaeon]
MSKVEKMRGRLASMQKDREEFEKQKKELEEQMNIGRKNMDKIQKGLKNNVILNDPELLDAPNSAELNTPKRMSKRDMKSFIAQGASQAGAGVLSNMGATVSNGLNLNDGNNTALTAQIIIPSGPRISEWCFTGPLDSAPPIVKSKEMYENVRLLGRGAFGEVNLVKNVEDNKL